MSRTPVVRLLLKILAVDVRCTVKKSLAFVTFAKFAKFVNVLRRSPKWNRSIVVLKNTKHLNPAELGSL
jgi:hypothetical protein